MPELSLAQQLQGYIASTNPRTSDYDFDIDEWMRTWLRVAENSPLIDKATYRSFSQRYFAHVGSEFNKGIEFRRLKQQKL